MVGGEQVDESLAASVVRVGNCSGTLIAPSAVLTAAHCVEADGSVEVRIPSSATTARVRCVVHPRYRSSEPAHDLAVCRLDSPSSATPIPLMADGPPVVLGASVNLVGYGLAAPFERGTGEVRSVDTRVGKVSNEGFLAGTVDRTACRGDSGGPMIVRDGATARVAGVIHGPSGAFCASPAIVVGVAGDLAWIANLTEPDAVSYVPFWVGGVAAVLVVARIILGRARRRT